MLQHEAGEGLADDQADVERLAGIRPGGTARTLEDSNVIGMPEDDVAGGRKREHMLRHADGKIALQCQEFPAVGERDNLAMVTVGKRTRLGRRRGRGGGGA
jgi:hypothetical protein